jgi:hypothetical protein
MNMDVSLNCATNTRQTNPNSFSEPPWLNSDSSNLSLKISEDHSEINLNEPVGCGEGTDNQNPADCARS